MGLLRHLLQSSQAQPEMSYHSLVVMKWHGVRLAFVRGKFAIRHSSHVGYGVNGCFIAQSMTIFSALWKCSTVSVSLHRRGHIWSSCSSRMARGHASQLGMDSHICVVRSITSANSAIFLPPIKDKRNYFSSQISLKSFRSCSYSRITQSTAPLSHSICLL